MSVVHLQDAGRLDRAVCGEPFPPIATDGTPPLASLTFCPACAEAANLREGSTRQVRFVEMRPLRRVGFVTDPAGVYEWRVATLHLGATEPLIWAAPDEEYAREFAELERAEYPHATVTVERRRVEPWERLE